MSAINKLQRLEANGATSPNEEAFGNATDYINFSSLPAEAHLVEHSSRAAASVVLGRRGADSACNGAVRATAEAVDGVRLDAHVGSKLTLGAPGIIRAHAVIRMLKVDERIEFVALRQTIPGTSRLRVLGGQRRQDLDLVAAEMLSRSSSDSAAQRSLRATSEAIDGVRLDAHVGAELALGRPRIISAHAIIRVLEVNKRIEFVALWQTVPCASWPGILCGKG